jgi:ATP-dependent RNA helicase DDX19/DBP5
MTVESIFAAVNVYPSGKTAAFSLGVLSRVNIALPAPQVIILCPVRELANQVTEVIRGLAAYTSVTIHTAVPSQDRGAPGQRAPRAPREAVTAQIVVGTPGTVDALIASRALDVRNVSMFVADEADQMVAQEGLGDKTVQIKRKLPRQAQVLLFSATFDVDTRRFAKAVAPGAVEIMVETEQLSLDTVQQYYMACRDENDKYKALTDIFSLLEIGQSIIFVHVRDEFNAGC